MDHGFTAQDVVRAAAAPAASVLAIVVPQSTE
jgi:hypothetical protein